MIARSIDRTPQRRVVCAAIRDLDGLIVCGARHFDSIMRDQIHALRSSWSRGEEQGFIDQRGEFLTREEAWKVAEAAGQIIRRVGGDGKRLFSENLY